MPRRVELHCHTVFSDGTLTPAELVARAVKSGVDLLVLTDHDSVPAAASCPRPERRRDLATRLGIEINCAGKARRTACTSSATGLIRCRPGFGNG